MFVSNDMYTLFICHVIMTDLALLCLIQGSEDWSAGQQTVRACLLGLEGYVVVPKSVDLVLLCPYKHEVSEAGRGDTQHASHSKSYCKLSRLDAVMLTGCSVSSLFYSSSKA